MAEKTFLAPTVLPTGDLMPHMSARMRHQVCDTVFEMLGGAHRLFDEANRDRDSYWEFMKLWSKGLPRIGGQENVSRDSVESILEELNAERDAKTIDITPRDGS